VPVDAEGNRLTAVLVDAEVPGGGVSEMLQLGHLSVGENNVGDVGLIGVPDIGDPLDIGDEGHVLGQ